MRLIKYLLLLALAACVPAQTPDVLLFTPGAPVTVSAGHVQTPLFELDYPPAWKLVTGETNNPNTVYIVAPDESAYIWVYVGETDTTPAPEGQQREVITFVVRNETVNAVFTAAPEVWPQHYPTFEQVINSLR